MNQNSYILKLVYFEEDGSVKFGWKKSDDISIVEKDTYIVSSCSETEVYTSVSDLYSYIEMSYGSSPEHILKEWSDNVPLFESYLQETISSYKKDDALFLIKLCKLCTKTERAFLFRGKKYFIY